MVKIGIVGISGYSGGKLLERLLKHPQVKVTYISANNTEGPVAQIWPHLNGLSELVCKKYDPVQAATKADIMFLAVPHTVSMTITPELLKLGKKVIDLSGDYRLPSGEDYKTWYKTDHQDKANLKKAVYGLPELYREDIKKAQLVSNPGCYPTAALLGLLPIITAQTKDIESIAIDAKSGVSGAGRKATLALSFGEVNENFKAYKVLNHQHTPEIDLHLSKVAQKPIEVDFVPHLLPVQDGILETIYVRLSGKVTLEKIHQLYQRFYKTENFVRVLDAGQQVELNYVVGTNFCDISLAVSRSGKLLVVTCAIDNLLKGASGQAIQNMNIMCGFKETEGLL
ncbi:MAG TPA: N-acetyl-gamma-glutamyl-phosphate reductase [Candidatus Omnitrophota bacterium]|nr:N-acetyl-gamma-glutamyl-phosphate reductase [Candidatus Omnitrophota bacterium]